MFLHFAFELFPVTFDAIPIHDMAPLIDYDVELSKTRNVPSALAIATHVPT
jgi:hypothetical protein